jgi:ATP citrate (pro-S)-lyase
LRSVDSNTKEVFGFPQIRSVALIAEGVLERHARELARKNGVLIIGLATVD